MSHEMSFAANGEMEMAYVKINAGSVPWHKGGIPMSPDAAFEEFLVASNMLWDPEMVQIFYDDGTGVMVPYPDKFVILRGDTKAPLGIATDHYNAISNRRAMEATFTVAKNKDLPVETLGQLFGGREAWCLFRYKEDMMIGPDKHERYILVHTCHDGKGAVSYKNVMTRVVCNNTLTFALSERGRGFSIRHNQDFDEEIRLAEGIFGVSEEKFLEFKKRGEEMQQIVLPDDAVDSAIETFAKKATWSNTSLRQLGNAIAVADREAAEKALIEDSLAAWAMESALETYEKTKRKKDRYKRAVELIHARLDEEKERAGSDITAWILAQSMTGFTEHERSNSRGDRHLSSQLFGQGDKLKNEAFEIVQQAVVANS